MQLEHATVLADPMRVKQFYRIFETRSYLNDAEFWFDDQKQIPWLVKVDNEFSVAISLLDSGRWFTAHSRRHWAEEYERKVQQIRSMPVDRQSAELMLVAKRLRFGGLSTRLAWLIHAEAIRNRSTELKIPASFVRYMVWGAKAPQRWRQDLKMLLTSISALHIADQVDGDNRALFKFGDETSLLTHFKVPKRGEKSECRARSKQGDDRKQEYVQIVLGLGWLGGLERLAGAGTGGKRKLQLPSVHDDKQAFRQNEQELKRVGKSGRISSIFLPAILGSRKEVVHLNLHQRMLFQVVFRERTRAAKKQRKAIAETEVFTGNLVRPPSGRRQGSKSSRICCPILSDAKQYSGFNGNRKLKGMGYKISTWRDKAGSCSTADFLDDLHEVSLFYDLKVAIVDPKNQTWIDLKDAREQLVMRRHDIERRHLRIYVEADFEHAWSAKLGWNTGHQSEEDDSAIFANFIRNSEYQLNYWSEVFAIDPSLLSKIVHGKRKCSQKLIANFYNWVEFHGITVEVAGHKTDYQIVEWTKN